MNKLKFLKTINELLDTNETDAAKTLLEVEISYETLQEVKNNPTTYIYPYDPHFMKNTASNDSATADWLAEFKKVTCNAEKIIVHPTTWAVLTMSDHDMGNVVIDPYWD
jgi:hypothetical protein